MKKLLSLILVIIMLLSTVSCTLLEDFLGDNVGDGTLDDDNDGYEEDDEDQGSDNSGSTGNNGGNSDNTDSGDNGSSSDEQPSPDYPEEDIAIFNALFSYENHIEIKLDISDSELKKLQQDYEKYASFGSKSPIYRMADMIITITTPDGNSTTWTIEQVGVRMKGNTSRTDF